MGSKRPMQGLIMEILNAHPSLRDSKTYLNSFGPRVKPQQPGVAATPHIKSSSLRYPSTPSARPPFPMPDSAQAGPPPPPPSSQPRSTRTRTPSLTSSSSHTVRRRIGAKGEASRELQAQQARHEITTGLPSTDSAEQSLPVEDSHHFAQPDYAVRGGRTDASLTQTDLQTPISPASQAALAEQLSSPPVQQHTALVKVQGPFTARQMDSIAEGMLYLKRLGLVSVIVLDSEDVAWQSTVSRFSPKDGKRIESEADGDLAPWLPPKPQSTGQTTAGGLSSSSSSSSSSIGKMQEVLRKQMLSFATRLAELLSQKGATARPFSHALMRIDAEAVNQSEAIYPPQLTDCPSLSSDRRRRQWGAKRPVIGHRSPLVSEDGLIGIRTALLSDVIPVIAPLALYADPDVNGAPRTVCVPADDVVVGLAREMAAEGRAVEAKAERTGYVPTDAVDMMPLRLMVINREGGVPSHARGGSPHLSINLASEYSHIMDSFIWNESHPTALSNLSMVRDCLAFMPHTSSGVVVSHRSPKSLIGNLITNKAAHSPSLPHRLLAGRKDVRHTPTIVRPGLSVRVLLAFDQVDWSKMTELLEKSFRRDLNAESYYARLAKCMDFVIVMGDYQGAAIVTHEFAPNEDKNKHESIAYLDKFAVLPNLQGSGAVDFLWGALRDEVHGLGLLDALNDNGGKGGFGVGRDLVWKSRTANPVNKWYFERSNGFVRIDPSWTMFWADAEQRLSVMSGEHRLGAEASTQEIMDLAQEGRRQAAAWDVEDDADLNVQRISSSSSPEGLAQLYSGEVQRLLPVIAPSEEGRLARWARCMSSIPTAWK